MVTIRVQESSPEKGWRKVRFELLGGGQFDASMLVDVQGIYTDACFGGGETGDHRIIVVTYRLGGCIPPEGDVVRTLRRIFRGDVRFVTYGPKPSWLAAAERAPVARAARRWPV